MSYCFKNKYALIISFKTVKWKICLPEILPVRQNELE